MYFVFTAMPMINNLRTRLLSLHLLETVLPSCDSNDDKDHAKSVSLALKPISNCNS